MWALHALLEPCILSGRRSARPKSLAISTPTKLLSLEEARQKAVASCSTERQQVYLDVGGGPANLPPVYHTVIDLPKGFVSFRYSNYSNGMLPDGVLPCWWYVARAYDHWPFQAKWIPVLADCASVSIPQPGGTLAPSRSSPVTWWSKQCANDSVMIVFGIHWCHVLKKWEQSPLNKRRNLRAAGSLCDSGIGYMSDVWDLEDFYGMTVCHLHPFA